MSAALHAVASRFSSGGTPFTLPELPRFYQLTRQDLLPLGGGTVHLVHNQTDFDTALGIANDTDRIVVDNGLTLTFNATRRFLNRGASTAYVDVISASVHNGTFPRGPNERVHPTLDSASMFTIVTANAQAAFDCADGAGYYRFIGAEFAIPSSSTGFDVAIIKLDPLTKTAAALAALPHHFIFDRCYIHGLVGKDTRRGILANAAWVAMVNGWMDEIHVVGFESSGFASWGGSGPFKIENNHIEAGTENVLFGGADGWIPGVRPSDITCRYNHLFKPLSWIGAGYGAKDHYEHKDGVRSLVEFNQMENCWQDGQTGNSNLLQVLSDNNTAPWTSITDITYRYNFIVSCGAGNVLSARVAFDTPGVPGSALIPDSPLARVHIHDNVYHEIGTRSGDLMWLYQFGGDIRDLLVEHNTGAAPSAAMVWAATALAPAVNLQFLNNIVGRGEFGFFGDSKGEGSIALTTYAPSATVAGNVMYGTTNGAADPSIYPNPTGNTWNVADITAMAFNNAAAGDYRLTTAFRGAGTDGRDPGADIAGLNIGLAGNGSNAVVTTK